MSVWWNNGDCVVDLLWEWVERRSDVFSTAAAVDSMVKTAVSSNGSWILNDMSEQRTLLSGSIKGKPRPWIHLKSSIRAPSYTVYAQVLKEEKHCLNQIVEINWKKKEKIQKEIYAIITIPVIWHNYWWICYINSSFACYSPESKSYPCTTEEVLF